MFFFAEEVVNVIVEGGAVPALVCHLKEPPAVAVLQEEQQPRPFEHEVEKGAAFALGLLAVKVPCSCRTSFYSHFIAIIGISFSPELSKCIIP